VRVPIITAAAAGIATVAAVVQYTVPGVVPLLARGPGPDEWWRLVTPLLVQTLGWYQVVMNLVTLPLVGACVEWRLGRWRWVALFVAGTVGGQIAAFAWHLPGGGDSIAICGLAGGMVVWLLRGEVDGRTRQQAGGAEADDGRVSGPAWPLAGGAGSSDNEDRQAGSAEAKHSQMLGPAQPRAGGARSDDNEDRRAGDAEAEHSQRGGPARLQAGGARVGRNEARGLARLRAGGLGAGHSEEHRASGAGAEHSQMRESAWPRAGGARVGSGEVRWLAWLRAGGVTAESGLSEARGLARLRGRGVTVESVVVVGYVAALGGWGFGGVRGAAVAVVVGVVALYVAALWVALGGAVVCAVALAAVSDLHGISLLAGMVVGFLLSLTEPAPAPDPRPR
jgi:hypothetical protein